MWSACHKKDKDYFFCATFPQYNGYFRLRPPGQNYPLCSMHTFLGCAKLEAASYSLYLTALHQAVGALGELSDKSDFSLLPWDSFSQEIYYYSIVKNL